MKTIMVNGNKVNVSQKTYRKIEKIATEKGLSFAEAVSFCLEKVN